MQKIWLQTPMESRGSGAFMERQSIHIKEIEYAMKRAQENRSKLPLSRTEISKTGVDNTP